MSPWDVRADMAYENGAFRLQSAMSWAVQLAAETARRRGDAVAFQALHAASRSLPLAEEVPARPAVLERFAPDSHYHAWLAHPRDDEYWARRSPGAGGGVDFSFFIVMAMVFGIFYLLVFRPQQKKMKEHQAMIDAVKRGDTVVTSGGIIGKVIRVGADGELRVEIADNVQVRLLKGSISDVRGKGEPVKEKAKAEEKAYQDALKRIPDPKEKYDPWKTAR